MRVAQSQRLPVLQRQICQIDIFQSCIFGRPGLRLQDGWGVCLMPSISPQPQCLSTYAPPFDRYRLSQMPLTLDLPSHTIVRMRHVSSNNSEDSTSNQVVSSILRMRQKKSRASKLHPKRNYRLNAMAVVPCRKPPSPTKLATMICHGRASDNIWD